VAQDILARGDERLAAAGVPGIQGPPDANGVLVIWDSADPKMCPYQNAMMLAEITLVIETDEPSAPDGVIFAGSSGGGLYDSFLETDEVIVAEDGFEKTYRPRSQHVRLIYVNGPTKPGKWRMSLTTRVG